MSLMLHTLVQFVPSNLPVYRAQQAKFQVQAVPQIPVLP